MKNTAPARFLLLFLAALGLAGPLALRAQSTPDTVTIPLQLVQLASGDFKLGISVSLGGGPFKLYEFDTGASGFYAANNTAWWSNYTTVNSTIVTQMYSSGIFYNSTIVNTTVDFGNGIPTLTANMAQIQAAGGGSLGNWAANVTAGIPPLYGAFFGDFGIGLSSGNGIFGLLPQLPGKLADGFIIRTGGFAHPNPTLQIGITDSDRANFTIVVPMNGTVANVTFPNSGYPTYAQQIILANATFSLNGNTAAFPTGLVLDTGAPSMELHDNGINITLPDSFLDGKQVIPGTAISLTNGDWYLQFYAGNVSGQNLANDASDPSNGRINTGLITFFTYDVMFDLKHGVVRFFPNALDPQPAYISSQPQAVTTSPGFVATFTVGANGNPTPNFQWQVTTNQGRAWTNVANSTVYAGAANPTLSVKTTAAMNGYSYRVLLNPGQGQVVSVPALLLVGAPPKIVSQPASRTVKKGQSIMFRVTATGKAPLQYGWYYAGGLLSKVNGIKASGPSLLLTRITSANAGFYQVVVTSPYGTASSIPFQLTVQ
jgi:hypothetical protein